MVFTDSELDALIEKKVDKILFNSGTKTVFFLDTEAMIKKKIDTDPALKKQLLRQVLQSDE